MRSKALWTVLLLMGCRGEASERGQNIDTGEITDTGEALSCYQDSDGDGYGDASTVGDCLTSGFVENAGDCDDTDVNVNPAAEEICDGIDNNCSGEADGADASDAQSWYLDGDGDGYGSPDDVVQSCDAIDGRQLDQSDCDDNNNTIYPDAPESCYDGVDSNCDDADNLTGCSLSLLDADATLSGVNTLDLAGYSVANAGDLNSDGFDDILVGARLEDTGGEDAGIAYVVYGPVEDMSLSDADVKLTGGSAGDYAGIQVAGNADVDGDGNLDVLVGALKLANSSGDVTGGAYVVYGPVEDMSLSDADVVLLGESDGEEAGRAVAMAGDVDNDGLADILVGARNNSGSGTSAGVAYLVFGGTPSGDLAASSVLLQGAAQGDAAGYSLGSAGDVDGDGLADILVGAYRADQVELNVGASYVLQGGGALSGLSTGDALSLSDADAVVYGEAEKDQTGASLSTAGDVDGDGYEDLLLGSHYYDSEKTEDVGIAYLLLGGLSGTVQAADAHASFVGDSSGDAAGRAVASLDFNADGRSDLLIGAKEVDTGATDAGAAYLFLGPVSGALSMSDANGAFISSIADNQTGTSVSTAGDVNGDGREDFVLGGASADGGYAYVILGGDW